MAGAAGYIDSHYSRSLADDAGCPALEAEIETETCVVGGGLAGLAGLSEVAGPIGQLLPTISPGYGFTAIIVAFLGRLHPLGVLLAGLVILLT